MSGRVVIVGRPNVGKSTLFNRIVGKRKSIVEDTPGVTRDTIEVTVQWAGKEFIIVDTGGLVTDTHEDILRKVKETVEKEIDKADLILFVVSARDGVTPLDKDIARILEPYRAKVLLVVNKADTQRDEESALEFYELGYEKLYILSAIHRKGVGELLDYIVDTLPEEPSSYANEGIKVALVGRPNVGKSSIVNSLLGRERVIVSPIAGTTRDAVEVPFRWKGKDFLLVDTAGLRRRSRVDYGIEFFSVGRSLKAIELCDVACLVLDASEGVTRQDKRIGGLIERRHKGCVIVANKMDMCSLSEEEVKRRIREELFFLDYAPLVLTVATTGEGMQALLEQVIKVYSDYTRQHRTSFVNRSVRKILTEKPLYHKGKAVKVYYAFQEGIKPPSVVIITNFPDAWKDNYRRFFTKRLRELLNIRNSPLKLTVKGRE